MESREENGVAKGGGWRKSEDVGQGVQSFRYAGWVSSGDLMCSRGTMDNDTVMYLNLLREYLSLIHI